MRTVLKHWLLSGGGGFTIPQLPGVRLWVNGDNLSTSGSNVESATNLIEGDPDFVKISDTRRPTLLAADLGGKNVIDFDKTSNQALKVDPGISGLTDYTMHLIFKADETGSGTKVLFSNVQNIGGTYLQEGWNFFISANNIYVSNRSGVTQSKNFAFSDTSSYHVLTMKFQGVGTGTSKLRVKLDGVYKLDFDNLNPLVASDEIWYMGSTPDNASFNGKIATLIVSEDYGSEQDDANVYEALNSYYGLSLPTGKTGTEFYQSLTYSSTIDSISNLFVRVCYDDLQSKPLLVVMHGFNESATDFTDATLARFKDAGYFVLAVGLRSFNGASGTSDASARELQDIYDAIQFVKSRFSVQANQTRVAMVGYSGGGGNTLGFISKYPDLLCLAVVFFGISDYGYDGTYGWYAQTGAGNKTALETRIGDTPANVPNEYKSRQHLWSASNFKGKLFIYHDSSDSVVDVNHSQRVVAQLIADSFTNYTYSESDPGDGDRWLHGLPNAGVSLGEENIAAEATYLPLGLTEAIPSMPTSGTLKVNGYMKCSLFTLWLGNGTAAEDGQNRRATLVYDYNTNTYTLTPSLDSPATDLTYSFTDDQGRTASGTISSETEFNPS